MPAGWYPDHSGTDQLRWWDGETWGAEVRPLVIDIVPDFSTPVDKSRLASTPEPSVPAPTSEHEETSVAPLTRRQLRELLGGPLTTEAQR